MSRFANASMIERRQIIEDALADVLRGCGEIMHNSEGERCFAVLISSAEATSEWRLFPLWSLACRLEVKL